MIEQRIVRFVLPPLIVFLSLPDVPLGIFGLVVFVVSRIADKPDPGPHEVLGIFWAFCTIVAMLAGRIELICIACAVALCIWLVLRGRYTLTKVCICLTVLVAVYGHYLLQSGFLNR